MWRSRRAFEADYFASYKESGLQDGPKYQPMGATIIGMGARRKAPKLPRKVAAALSVLDDLILDAIIWYHSVVMVLWNKPPDLDKYFDRAIMALFMRVAQDSMVVRNLMEAGFDIQARNLLRSIEEHVDAIYFLCLQPAACEQFVRTEDGERANRFWWEHLRGARKVINKAFLKIVKEDAYVRELVEFRNQERSMLSAAHHPSYVACTMPFISPYSSMNETRYLFGLPSEYSLRTGKLLFYVLAEAAVVSGILNKEMDRLTIGGREADVDRLIRQGRKHLAMMLLLVVKNWSCPLFGTSKQFEALMKRLPKEEF